jgi:hypothetical protein
MTSAKYSASIETVDVATSAAGSDVISYGDFEKGMVHVPAGSSLTTLTWHVSSSEGGTYLPANNASGAITQTVTGGNAYPIPSDLVGARFLKITGNAAGVVGVTLKD